MYKCTYIILYVTVPSLSFGGVSIFLLWKIILQREHWSLWGVGDYIRIAVWKNSLFHNITHINVSIFIIVFVPFEKKIYPEKTLLQNSGFIQFY